MPNLIPLYNFKLTSEEINNLNMKSVCKFECLDGTSSTENSKQEQKPENNGLISNFLSKIGKK